MAYRILALDGGGAWAIIQAMTLAQIYGPNTKGHDVLAQFDMVAATSGGSIVLGGLVENLPMTEIVNYFKDDAKRRSIFSPTSNFVDQVLEGLLHFGPKYSAKRKLPALELLMPTKGQTPMLSVVSGIRRMTSGTDVHLLITGFDYNRNRACFFRSAEVNRAGWGTGAAATVTVAEAIHASTNAPVMFFDEAARFPAQPNANYWDGAISGCNNPVLAAVAEALALNVPPSKIAALSIGTGGVFLPWAPNNPQPPFTQGPSPTGFVNDLQKLASAIVDDPPDVASYLAHVMTGGPIDPATPTLSRIVRMNPMICPVPAEAGGWGAPDGMSVAQFEHLAGIPMDVPEPSDMQYIINFTEIWQKGLSPNQPVRMDPKTLAIEVGQGTFANAYEAWGSISK